MQPACECESQVQGPPSREILFRAFPCRDGCWQAVSTYVLHTRHTTQNVRTFCTYLRLVYYWLNYTKAAARYCRNVYENISISNLQEIIFLVNCKYFYWIFPNSSQVSYLMTFLYLLLNYWYHQPQGRIVVCESKMFCKHKMQYAVMTKR